MFKNTIKAHLADMGFDPDDFYRKIFNRFPDSIVFFDFLLKKFYPQNNLETSDFNNFIERINLDKNKNIELYNVLYEVFNNIRQFKNGGKLGVFKEREAIWGLPSNILDQADINDLGDLMDLSDKIEIFRGMSQEEDHIGDFGQSWSVDYQTACSFAETVYEDKLKGIVVKTTLDKSSALHYDKNKEYEVIVKKRSISKAVVNRVPCVK